MNAQSKQELPVPQKILTYPIAAEPNAGAVFLFGESDAPRIALLCAGFPDDHESFLPLAKRLADEAGCLVGVTCQPGFDDREDFPYEKHRQTGYTIEEMVGCLREAAKVLRGESSYAGGAKFVGIFHDFGVITGSIFTNRCIEEDNDSLTPDRIVLFDVLGPVHPEAKNAPAIATGETLYETVILLSYRSIFVIAFWIRTHISKILAQVYAIFFLIGITIFRLGPTLDIDAKVVESRSKPVKFDRLIYMAYPYAHIFPKDDLPGFCLPKDLAKTPVLYMYGTEKRVMFHDKDAVGVLEKEAADGHKSNAVAVEKAGHWLYLHQPDVCFKEVSKFVTEA